MCLLAGSFPCWVVFLLRGYLAESSFDGSVFFEVYLVAGVSFVLVRCHLGERSPEECLDAGRGVILLRRFLAAASR
jgi:hypothetical protein